MLDKKDKAAIGGILVTSLITNLVWITVFIQHHNEWKEYCDKILAFTNEMNDMWYSIAKGENEE